MLKLCLLQVTSCAVVVVILSNWPRLIAADVYLDYPGDLKLGALFPIHKQVRFNN